MTLAALLIALIATPGADAMGEPTLLDFHASWCGPCRQMRPAIELLIRKGYQVRSIDIDQHPELAERYKVAQVPTFIIVDPSGRSMARTLGAQPAAQLARLYREAKDKIPPPAPARPRTIAHEDDDGVEEETADDPQGGERPEHVPVNPNPWQSVVRIKVHGQGSIGFGSGTIIHSTPEESIILTCAHIFKLEGPRQAPPSRFPRRITVDLFDGKLVGQTVHYANESFEGQAIDYDFNLDVGLIRIRPGRRLPASRVVPATWRPRERMAMLTVGCSEGHDATAWNTMIVNPTFRGLVGNGSYEAMACTTAPKQGRSGGGLFTTNGYIAGVCDFAEPTGNHGLYASPRSIHALLDRNHLTALYTPVDRRPETLLAQDRPAPRRTDPPTIARAQSPDRDESNVVTIPPPELLGIKTPEVAAGRTPRVASARRGTWHATPTASPTARLDSESEPGPGPETEPAEMTDLKLAPAADNDRFDAMPGTPGPGPEPTETDRTSRPSSRGKWRPVRTEPMGRDASGGDDGAQTTE